MGSLMWNHAMFQKLTITRKNGHESINIYREFLQAFEMLDDLFSSGYANTSPTYSIFFE